MSFALQEYFARIEAFQAASKTSLLTLLIAKSSQAGSEPVDEDDDDSGSAGLKFEVALRELLSRFSDYEEIGFRSRSLCFAFANPADALIFALRWQEQIDELRKETGALLFDRVGIHTMEELHVEPGSVANRERYRADVIVCTHLADLCEVNSLLLSRKAFVTTRSSLKKDQIKDLGRLAWINHGPYELKHVEGTIQICTVAPEGHPARLRPPTEKPVGHPQRSPDDPTIWGWRPGVGVPVPGTRCVLDDRLPDSRFGEVWSAHDEAIKDRRTFRFCFRTDWVALLKNEQAALEVWKRKSGENRNLLGLFQISLDEQPFFLMTEFFEGKGFDQWSKDLGGIPSVPFVSRIEIIAQAASGLQTAHEGKIVHRDLRPEHLLVFGTGASAKDVQVKVTDFCIGHVGRERETAAPPPAAPTPPAAIPDAAKPDGADATPALAPGTNPYAAPEIIAGQSPSPKSDVYALGVLLCQLILSDLSAALAPERIKEILEVLKRPSLLPFFAEKVEERAEGAAKVARELRSALKERDTRVTWRAGISRRQLIGTIALAVFLVIGLAIVVIVGPKNLFKKKTDQTEEVEKPAEKTASSSPASSGPARTVDESELTPVPVGESAAGGSRANVTHKSKPLFDPESESTKSLRILFKFLVLPIIVVIALGTVLQRFGPQIKKFLGRAD